MKVHCATQVNIRIATETSRTGGRCDSVLPSPAPLTQEGLSSAAAELYVLVARRRDTGAETSKERIGTAGERSKELVRREEAAAAREKQNSPDAGEGFFGCLGDMVSDLVDDVLHARLADAVSNVGDNASEAWNSPSFWKDLEKGAMIVAKVAAVAAAAAATVATFGAAGPAAVLVIAGVVLSSAATVESEFHVLEKCGVDKDVAGKLSLGMSIGGAACSGVGGIWNAAGAAASTASAAQTASSATTTAGKAATHLAAASNVLAGTSTAVAGAASMRSAEFQENAGMAAADRKEAAQARARFDRLVVTMIASLEEGEASARRTLDGLVGAMQTHGQTLVLSSARG